VTAAAPLRPRVRLWMKLAALAGVGVVAMHALHLAIGNRIASRALAGEMESLGRGIARLVAQQATDPLLVNDVVTLHEVVAAAAAGDRVGYCFLMRDGRVLASSFQGGTPSGLVALRPAGDARPVVVHSEGRSLLDVAEPILGGELGEVRIGLDLGVLRDTRHRLATELGLLALALTGAGLLAALWMGRSIARPVGLILEAADRFDLAAPGGVTAVAPRGSDEIAVLADRFNRMTQRLADAYRQEQEARRQAVETERLVALGSLVAGVAHEVNNPLAGLKNCLRRLERGDLPEPKRREYLSLMEEGLYRIEEVVKRLLDFGRPHPVMMAPIGAGEVAREAARLVEPLLERRGVATSVLTEDGAEGLVLADRHQAGQAVVNLLLNAAYVTPDDGRR